MKAFRWLGVTVGLMVMAVGFWGCGGDSTDSGTTYASVRFIHSSPSIDLMDFACLVQNEDYYYSIVEEVAYGEQHGYYSVVSGTRSFRVYTSGTSLSIASITFSSESGRKYTIIADDLDAAINPSLLAIADTTEAPESGKAFLRFVHVSADAPAMDIRKADSSLLVFDLERYQASGYVDLDAGTYDFLAFSSGTDSQILALPPLTLTSGISYTVLLSGSAYGLPGVALNAKIYQETGVE
jgi:hypothetical protein